MKKSLDGQTNKNFEWIIIDDGSIDCTEEIVKKWINNTDYPIYYFKQENTGKHIAFNKAVKMANGAVFVCVDSDDELIPEAIQWITDGFLELDPSDVGVVSPRIDRNGLCDENWKYVDSKKIDIIDLKELYGIVESAIAIRTSVLKDKEPFVNFESENFLPEGWLYLNLSKKGKFLAKRKGYYISEYQETGLTKNLWKHWKNNYRGVLATLKKKYVVSNKYDFCRREKVQAKIILNINSLCLATHISIFEVTPSKLKSGVLLIPSWIIYKMRYEK